MKKLNAKFTFLSIAVFISVISFGYQSGDASKYIEKAKESERMGKEKDAVGYLTTAIQLDPKNVTALTERASLLILFGDYQNALKDYRKAIQLKPSENLYYKAGVAELNSGDDEKAIIHLTKAIKLNPKKEFYYFFRAEAQFDLGKYRAAIKDYNKALSLKPDDYRAIYKRGLCYYNVHDYNHSVKDFDKALKLYSYDTEMYFYRGAAYFNLAKYNEAIADFTTSLEKNPENHDALINRAKCYEYSKNYKEADKDYSLFISHHKMNPQVNYAAANVKYSLADFVGAEELYSNVITKQSKNKMAYFHRGMARFNQRKMDLACADFIKSKNLGYLAGYDQMKGNCK